jgi:hypothetical protein
MPKFIDLKTIERGISYSEYLELTRELLSQGKTTCSNDSPSLVGYTKLNLHRMERLNRTIQLEPETIEQLRHLSRPLYWVLLSEPWCGDAAQNVPVIAKMAGQTDQIKLIILLRDENPHIMDRYLTKGARAIPRLICLRNPDLRELWDWGPRPEPAQQLMKAHKANPVEPKETVLKNIQLWYAGDRGKTIQRELIDRIAKTEN